MMGSTHCPHCHYVPSPQAPSLPGAAQYPQQGQAQPSGFKKLFVPADATLPRSSEDAKALWARMTHVQRGVSVATLFVVTSIMMTCVGSSSTGADNDRPSEPSSGETPKATTRSVDCKFGGGSKTVTCTPEDATYCAAMEKEVLCREEYLDVITGSINNWKKQKKWGSYKGKMTWFDLSGAKKVEHKGKDCLKASMNAAVYFCPGASGVQVTTTGYGRLAKYDENVLVDDLVVEVLETYDRGAATNERSLRQLAALKGEKEATMQWLVTHASLSDSLVAPELLLSGLSAHEVFATAKVKRAAKEKEDAAAEAEAKRQAVLNSPAKYPMPCKEVAENSHIPVKGADDVCIPRGQGLLVAALGAQASGLVHALPDAPTKYGDDNPIAVLLPPNKATNDASQLTAAERSKIAAETRKRLYFSVNRNWGSWNWVEAASKLTGTIDLTSERMSTGQPSITRKEDCDVMPGSRCDDRCSSHSDCSGWLCGCSQSRCTIFRTCTACPAQRVCGAPTFTLKVPLWKVSKVMRSDDEKKAAREAERGSHAVMTARVSGAWRRVFTKREVFMGEAMTKLEHDTGYFTRIRPTGLFLLDCKTSQCGRSARQLVAINAQPWSVTLPHGSGSVKVSCRGGQCNGSYSAR